MPLCKKIEPLLSSYFDGELDSRSSRQVEEHLKVCAHCREQLDAVRAVSRAFQELDVLEATDEFHDRLHLSLTAAAREQKMRGTHAAWYSHIPRWLYDWRTFTAAAACLLLVVVSGTGTFKNYSVPTSEVPVSTAVVPTSQPQSAFAVSPDATPSAEAAEQIQSSIDRSELESTIQNTAASPQQGSLAQISPTPPSSSGKTSSHQQTAPPLSTTAPAAADGSATVAPTLAPNIETTPLPTTNPTETEPPKPLPDGASKGGSGGGSSGASTYGIGQTTLYFQAADEAALQTASKIALDFGEVTDANGKVIIKVPNEQVDALLRALYATQGISQTGSGFEPIVQSDPKVNDALNYVYIVISLP